MQEVRGLSPEKRADRTLHISRLADDEVSLWIHPPISDNSTGWEIRVNPADLRRALRAERVIE